jgi:hypothetical protein
LIGFTPIYGGIHWSRPLLNVGASVTDLPSAWKNVDEKITPEMLISLTPQLDFKNALGDKFFLRDPTSMSPGVPRINSLTVKDGNQIQIDLSSPGGDYQAKCVFEAETLALKSAFLDGKQVYPR